MSNQIALLFLTYGDILHKNAFKDYFKEAKIYIHPKYPEQVSEIVKSRIIQPLIETAWGDDTLVIASLLLLNYAYKKNPKIEWFILCSQDSYPLKTYNEVSTYLNSQNKSIFTGASSTIREKTKSSQWWALKRSDAKIILEGLNFAKLPQDKTIVSALRENTQYKNILTWFNNNNKGKKLGAIDEWFFLQLLTSLNPSYSYTNACLHYTKWTDNKWIAKHPTTFNLLTEYDKTNIQNGQCCFIRKTFSTFKNKLVSKSENAIVIIIGTENVNTNYTTFLENYKNKMNIYLLVIADNILEQETKYLELREKCVQAFSAVYKDVSNASNTILQNMHTVYGYKDVFILPESYDANNLMRDIENGTIKPNIPNILEQQPKPKEVLPLEPKKTIQKEPLKQKNPDFKIAYCFLLRDDINHPTIWKNYFTNHSDKISLYVHSKEREKLKTDWLLKNTICDIRNTGWGYIVDAYLSLLRTAISNPKNMKFVMISESCLPIQKLLYFYDFLGKGDYRESYVHFMNVSNYDIESRIKNQKEYQQFEPFSKHYARFCLSRYHVEKLLSLSEDELNFFIKMHVGDEFFLTLLKAKPEYDYFKEYVITYDNWTDVEKEKQLYKSRLNTIRDDLTYKKNITEEERNKLEKEKNELKAKIEDISKNPKTYQSISNDIIMDALTEQMKKQKAYSFFWRKFPKTLDMDSYYNQNGELILFESVNLKQKGGKKKSKRETLRKTKKNRKNRKIRKTRKTRKY